MTQKSKRFRRKRKGAWFKSAQRDRERKKGDTEHSRAKTDVQGGAETAKTGTYADLGQSAAILATGNRQKRVIMTN